MSLADRRAHARALAGACLWVAAAATSACATPTPTPVAPPEAPPPAVASAAAAPTSPPPDPAAQKQAELARAALARVPEIAAMVAQVRGLPLKHPVPAEMQSQDDFRKFLEAQLAKDLPPEKSRESVRALVRLGFLKVAIDLPKTIEDAMLSQAGAYYDPDTKKFYLVIVPEEASMLDVMSAHELTHAIDDEYFDLATYTDDKVHPLTNDQQQARRMVGEGDATLVMLAYQAKVGAQQDIFAPENRRMEQAMVGMFSTLDSEALSKSATDSPGLMSQMGPSVKASIDAMSSIPPFILDPLFGAYTKGAYALAKVRDAGGWDAVGKLYTDPPESTEQLLHPMEKLVTKRDYPVALTFGPLPKLFAGKTPIDTDVVGELTMATYFRTWGDKNGPKEVVGWGGDRYAAFDVDGKVVAAWMTTWDTPDDATRFAQAFEGTFPARFAGEPVAHDHGVVRVTHPDGTVTTLSRAGKDVEILEGAPKAEEPGLLRWLGTTKRQQGAGKSGH